MCEVLRKLWRIEDKLSFERLVWPRMGKNHNKVELVYTVHFQEDHSNSHLRVYTVVTLLCLDRWELCSDITSMNLCGPHHSSVK